LKLDDRVEDLLHDVGIYEVSLGLHYFGDGGDSKAGH
jgi:hypothetical protein